MREFEMTVDQLNTLLDACNPVPMIAINICTGLTRQARANNAWAILGRDMGFDHMTARPIEGKDQRFFTAEEVLKGDT